MRAGRRALGGLLLALGAAGPAWAEDFTLTVPVRLTSLHPSVTGGVVACVVGPESVATLARPFTHPDERVGFGAARFTVDRASRGFVGTVVVGFDADAERDPGAATHYKCWLQLTRGAGEQEATSVPRPDAREPYLVPLPDAPATLAVTGELER